MSARIEHEAKAHAYSLCSLWKTDGGWYAKEKYEAHAQYLEDMRKSGKYYYGTPPRSRLRRLANYIGHLLIYWAWR